MPGEVTEWIDADGTATTLEVEWDATGRGMPPIRFEEDRVPERAGSRLRAVRHDTREMTLPLWITGSSQSDLWTNLRALALKMDPTRGNGKIRVTSIAGDQREVTCRYAAGLELNERLGDTAGPLVQRAPVLFRVHDPYWYAVSDTTEPFTVGTTATFFPFFPLRLSSSEVYATGSITNPGDVETWPVWTITGPGSAIVLRNLTTGKSLSLSTTLGAGESVVIDTREGVKTVTHSSGANLFSSLSATSSLWPLARGVNAFQIEMSAATTASLVSLAYRPRYLMV
ncbi:phage distal tail protein [Saccharothrix variisporea]|uniref:Tail protein n=1 Tax=Saccharothrix variisporea TaxID=543527 RepID=A0A495X0V2_9PSEU|nr:phage tail domain-containing protein [Saccharothrix variisporea]RKT67116.1 tail protein [Saccharothrix variisporea]